MFENAIIYRIDDTWAGSINALEEGLQKMQFEPCGPTQELSTGFLPARGHENGAMLESVGGQWIIKFAADKKTVPAATLNRELRKRLKAIEQETGRTHIGKREHKEIKDEIKLELLPQAFPKQTNYWVLIDPQTYTLYIDASSQAVADMVVTALVEASPGFSLSLLHTQRSPCGAMAAWLQTHDALDGFSIGRSLELKAADESSAAVKYDNHPLDIDEIREHISQGKLPEKLGMAWDDSVAFVLTDGLQLRKIEFLNVESKGDDADAFDADVALATGVLAPMVSALIFALGGEPKLEDML